MTQCPSLRGWCMRDRCDAKRRRSASADRDARCGRPPGGSGQHCPERCVGSLDNLSPLCWLLRPKKKKKKKKKKPLLKKKKNKTHYNPSHKQIRKVSES
eukprot:NODE_21207_length_764_cov_3.489796.p1 GENE.NODE_21207_length_764_cov_3.489796~~NODE_21207_length_764_cov_3.489796.p1  ORF type:complete len:99 (+),score=26.72 NODE_21207_length_764_cov_3.489796:422-718(+)